MKLPQVVTALLLLVLQLSAFDARAALTDQRANQQIDNAILPRLGRTMDYFGTKDKLSAIFSSEYRPTDDLHFYVDTMYSKRDDKAQRVAYNWAVRNNGVIPLNMTVDRSDCSAGLPTRTYASRFAC